MLSKFIPLSQEDNIIVVAKQQNTSVKKFLFRFVIKIIFNVLFSKFLVVIN
jgi:hypothetical protein